MLVNSVLFASNNFAEGWLLFQLECIAIVFIAVSLYFPAFICVKKGKGTRGIQTAYADENMHVGLNLSLMVH